MIQLKNDAQSRRSLPRRSLRLQRFVPRGGPSVVSGAARRSARETESGGRDTPFRPGGWTVRQVIHHLADAQVNWYIRPSSPSRKICLLQSPMRNNSGPSLPTRAPVRWSSRSRCAKALPHAGARTWMKTRSKRSAHLRSLAYYPVSADAARASADGSTPNLFAWCCVGSRVRLGSRHIGEGRDDRLRPGRAFQLGHVDCQLPPAVLPMCFRADFNRGAGNAGSLRPKLPSRLSVADRLRRSCARCTAGGCEEYRNHQPDVLHRRDILSRVRV